MGDGQRKIYGCAERVKATSHCVDVSIESVIAPFMSKAIDQKIWFLSATLQNANLQNVKPKNKV